MKAQISYEFVMIFGLVLFTTFGLFYLANRTVTELQEQRDYLVMETLAKTIGQEITLASQVQDNYLRRFAIPSYINGKEYAMNIEGGDILTMELLDEGIPSSTLTQVLPTAVKGTFIERITPDTISHCITKTNADGIRISRNQIALESDVSSATIGDVITVYVYLYCVDDITGSRFTIVFDTNDLEYIDNSLIATTQITHPQFPSFFNEYSNIFTYGNSQHLESGLQFFDPDNGRLTYGYTARSCNSGSGMFASLQFRIKSTTSSNTKISFDPVLKEYNEDIRLYDCNFDATSPGLDFARVPLEMSIT